MRDRGLNPPRSGLQSRRCCIVHPPIVGTSEVLRNLEWLCPELFGRLPVELGRALAGPAIFHRNHMDPAMMKDDLDDVETGAVAQGAAEQQAAAQEDAAADEPKGDDSAVPADTEQQADGQVKDGEGDGSTPPADPLPPEDVAAAEPPRARRVYLDQDLSFMIPPGATQIGDEMKVADDDLTRAFIEIEGEGPDVTVSFDDIWDEHFGTRRIVSWK